MPSQNATTDRQAGQQFNGKWWGNTNSEEHSGFINGLADCMTWSAHKKGFNATPEQLMVDITRFYSDNPSSTGLTILDVWRIIIKKSPPKPSPQGQTWKNAHWYLDGFWWKEASEAERVGFLEGYLWCMRTCVHPAAEAYSKPVSFYLDRINASVAEKGSSKTNRESVALILRRYQDPKGPGVAQP